MQQKIYFISDIHLGAKVIENPRAHEQKVVDLLEKISVDASKVVFLGDVFDFWFEYKKVVPKGYVRFLGKVAALIDKGIEVHFFIGNHDIWAFDYFRSEIGMIVHYAPETVEWMGKKLFLAHGDGLNDNDKAFKFVRNIFYSPFFQKLFELLPTTLGQNFGFNWSEHNRLKVLKRDNSYRGEANENLVRFSKKYIENHPVDFLVFGHRHLDLKLQLSKNAQMIILGDFYSLFSYGVFDGIDFNLEYF